MVARPQATARTQPVHHAAYASRMTDDAGPPITVRTTYRDGTIHETKVTPGQALDRGAGQPIAYFPSDETSGLDEDGKPDDETVVTKAHDCLAGIPGDDT